MLVSMLRPSRTAARLDPLPRWARITRPLAARVPAARPGQVPVADPWGAERRTVGVEPQPLPPEHRTLDGEPVAVHQLPPQRLVFPLDGLDALLNQAPRLAAADRSSMANDVRRVRTQSGKAQGHTDPWVS